jgi:glycosyltransferase involved in cell wall biosynthesis
MIRLAIQQRVIPAYRAPFLELLASHPDLQVGVFAGEPKDKEQIKIVRQLKGIDYQLSKNIHLFDGKFYICLQPEFKNWIEKWNPDVLIVEANPRYRSTPAVIQWMRQKNKPVIGWGLGVPEYFGLLSGLRNRSREKFLGSLSAIIAYSQKGAQQYIQSGFNPDDVYVAKNATAPAPTSPPPEHETWGDSRDPILLYVGRLQKRKRIDSLIRICARLPEKVRPQLWIVGDGNIKPELEALASNVYPKTTFWGEKFGQELSNLFSKADLFVLPGTGGLAVQQAMSFALPVIVADGDGTQSDLINHTNGWMVTPGDEQQLFQTIQTALNSPELLLSMGNAGYEIVKNQVNIENMVSVFVKACKDALNKGSKQ